MAAVKVLVIDDSQLIRSLLTEILDSDPGIEVVGTASDPFQARDRIKQLNPDVITLDIEMPLMDGITFLKNLMRLRPMPVVMISTLTTKGADITMEALELGAIDFISKPKLAVADQLKELSASIISKVKQASRVNVSALEHNARQEQFSKPVTLSPSSKLNGKVRLIAIGASTGGTEATKEVLSGCPEHMPPIVVVQHMPDGFTASYAKRLNNQVPLTVEEFTRSGTELKDDHVYIANGARHLMITEKGKALTGTLLDTDPVNRHKPSVDVLFESVATLVGAQSIGVLLTGMGFDGVRGLGLIKQAGAFTIAQDERSSVVWGMPRVAIEEGAASEVLPLGGIGGYLVERCYS